MGLDSVVVSAVGKDELGDEIIDNVKNKSYSFEGSNGGTNGIIDSQSDVGGWPELNSTTPLTDTDQDGMPDVWEVENKLDPSIKNANKNELSTAYNNIEVYLNGIVKNINEGQYK